MSRRNHRNHRKGYAHPCGMNNIFQIYRCYLKFIENAFSYNFTKPLFVYSMNIENHFVVTI